MSKSKAKGTAFETAVCDYLRAFFPTVERRALNGSRDRGDIANIPNTVLEVKNQKAMDLSGWLKEAKTEATNAGVTRYAVVHKRRGVGDVGEQYCTIPLYLLAELLAEDV